MKYKATNREEYLKSNQTKLAHHMHTSANSLPIPLSVSFSSCYENIPLQQMKCAIAHLSLSGPFQLPWETKYDKINHFMASPEHHTEENKHSVQPCTIFSIYSVPVQELYLFLSPPPSFPLLFFSYHSSPHNACLSIQPLVAKYSGNVPFVAPNSKGSKEKECV